MINWILNLADRTHLLFAPIVFMVIATALSVSGAYLSSDDLVRSSLPHQHFLGTSLLFILLPAYLVIAAVKQRDSAERMLAQLEQWSDTDSRQSVSRAMTYTPNWRYFVMFFGLLFGFTQNEFIVQNLIANRSTTMLDVVFVLQSAFLWVLIAEIVAWKFSVTYAISNFTQKLTIDIYETQKFGIVARMATTDVLMVAGAMAFMPLQSLDAEFRIQNYQAGFIVGISAAACLMMVPLFSAQRSILGLKQGRLAELLNIEKTIAKDDIERLETHLAHTDRIRSIPNWPIDLNLLTRIFGYVIIPPIAWVGAALVESLVNF